MEASRIRVSELGLAWILVPILIAMSGLAVSAADDETAARCNLDLSTFIPLPYSDTSNMICKPVWNTYVLQYSQTKDHVVTIVLSAVYTTGWVGMAFSKDGMMLNSSAMVGWIGKEGQADAKQYYLKGFEQADVVPGKGKLPLTSVPPFVALRGSTIYLAFQLKFGAALHRQPILLAFGSRYPTKHHHLYAHDDKTTIIFDFSAGSVSAASDVSDSGGSGSSSGSSKSIGHTKRTHGILGIIGWSLFLPYGAIAARYFKHHDPLWFYLHVGIQFVGFLLGLAGVLVGVSLYNTIHAHFPTHKGIGIFVLVLSILQIMAFFARPDKDSKIRKYWNWYHHWSGRIALFFGNINIVLGIQIGNAGNGWKAGYGFLLSTVLIATIVLEVLSRKRSKNMDNHPAFPMHTLQ
ncbi:Cytochrome b561 and DOMON domain-containing protein [Actinidia chinensis var. chinensis]|uniref:Cytochrome b561 and DOMON domain-containing protein n=1 Tax=Actinidia chinensis var. chinensis TaxID=1590841 RepID=A0A2R6RCK2_ACTCC|nr:Cytochrome b561 and DOMON domain-containing protein [Actinidia chinensis var. chinensis]